MTTFVALGVVGFAAPAAAHDCSGPTGGLLGDCGDCSDGFVDTKHNHRNTLVPGLGCTRNQQAVQ